MSVDSIFCFFSFCINGFFSGISICFCSVFYFCSSFVSGSSVLLSSSGFCIGSSFSSFFVCFDRFFLSIGLCFNSVFCCVSGVAGGRLDSRYVSGTVLVFVDNLHRGDTCEQDYGGENNGFYDVIHWFLPSVLKFLNDISPLRVPSLSRFHRGTP